MSKVSAQGIRKFKTFCSHSDFKELMAAGVGVGRRMGGEDS